jgi:hypothetical protein
MIAIAENIRVSLIIGCVSGAVAWVVTAAARYHLYKLEKMSSEASSSLSTTTESKESSNE